MVDTHYGGAIILSIIIVWHPQWESMALWMGMPSPTICQKDNSVPEEYNLWKLWTYNSLWSSTLLPRLMLLHRTFTQGPKTKSSSRAQYHKPNPKPGPGAEKSWNENPWSPTRGALSLQSLKNSARPSFSPCVILTLVSWIIFSSVLWLKYLNHWEHLSEIPEWRERGCITDLKMGEIFIYLSCISSFENSCEWLHNSYPKENWVPVPVWSERRNILKGKGPTERVPRKPSLTPLGTSFETGHPGQ